MFLRDLFEATRPGYLYHFMAPQKALNVFAADRMPARWDHTILGKEKVAGNAFTREPNLNFASPVKLTVDQRILSHNNRIVPLDGERVFYHSRGSRDDIRGRNHGKNHYSDMREEYVVGDIKNLHRCVVQIDLYCKSPGLHEASTLLELHEATVAYVRKFDIKLVVAPEVSKTIEDWLSRRPDQLRPPYTKLA